MTHIIDDYLREIRKRLDHLSLRERQAVLDEIEAHLAAEVQRLRQADKTLSKDEAALKATAAFGDPQEIGVAYGAHGGVINRSSGELLLEVAILTGRAAGRGARGVLKWSGIIAISLVGAALILVIVGLLFAGAVLDTFQDDIRGNVPHPLYSYEGSWSQTDAHSEVTTDTFQVRENVREFIITIDIQPIDTTGGCAVVTLSAPDGSVAFDSGTDCGPERRTLTLGQHGTWQIRYSFVAYSGSIGVDAYYFESVGPS